MLATLPDYILALLMICTLLVVVGALVVSRLAALPAVPNLARLRGFQAETYRPLHRLLLSAEVDFFRTLPGYSRSAERMFRRRRFEMFRRYLCDARKDFHAVRAAALYLSMHSPDGAPEIARELSRLNRRFTMQLFTLEMRGWLYLAGWDAQTVPGAHAGVTGVLESLTLAHSQMQRLVPVPSAL